MTTPPPEQDAPHVKTVLRLAAMMQRHALLFSLPLAVVAVILGAVLGGTPGLIGALLGAVALTFITDAVVVLWTVGFGLLLAALASAVPRMRHRV